MPKITKNSIYNLNSQFRSTITDDRYTQNDADNLLVWIKGDSTSALIDRSVNGRTVTEANLVSVTNNEIKDRSYNQSFQSVNLNGTNATFSLPDSNDLSFGDGTHNSSFSFSSWVRLTDLSAIHGIFGKASSTSTREYGLQIATSGNIAFTIYDESSNTTSNFLGETGVIAAGNWYHIVVTFSGIRFSGSSTHECIKVYLDGVLQTGTTSTSGGFTAMENLSSRLYFGFANLPFGDQYLKGDIAEVAVWRKELTASSVKALYHRMGYDAYESGFLNNPVRTIIRDNDNSSGAYPTVHRLNPRGSSGILSNTVFDDTKVVKFGNVIIDDFTIEEPGFFEKPVDSNKWVVSTSAVVVRKEFSPRSDLEMTTGAVVLAGAGSGASGRWLQTKNKVLNATLTFSLLRGPYNNKGALARFKLNLAQGIHGLVSDEFKLQISTDGTNYTDVNLKNIHLGSKNNNIVDETRRSVLPNLTLSSFRKSIFGLSSPPTGEQFRPVLNFKLDPIDFASVTNGFGSSFYIRFVQPRITDATTAVWAIGNVKIVSRDQLVTYPHLGMQDSATLYHLSQSIALPNFISPNRDSAIDNFSSRLTTTGSSIKGITDSGKLPFESQKIKPFNEESTIEYENTAFYGAGTNVNVLPGFSSPLLNKTKFEINLNQGSLETNVGLTTVFPSSGDVSGDGPQLMVYWNKARGTWEKIGKPIGLALNNKPTDDHFSISTLGNLQTYLTSSAVGFGPSLVAIFTSSDGGNSASNGIKLIEPSNQVLSVIGKPIDTFSFPYGAQYHATSSQHIQAKDLGITKPFVLEKTSLEFDIRLEMASNTGVGFGNMQQTYNEKFMHTNNALTPSARGAVTGLRTILPTFFILRQKKDNFTKNVKVNLARGAETAAIDNITTNFEITTPVRHSLVSGSGGGSGIGTIVDTSRDLITYKQPCFMFETDNWNDTNYGLTVSQVRDAGYPGDEHIIIDAGTSDVSGFFGYTGSIKLNSPVKVCSNYPPVTSLVVSGVNGDKQLNQYILKLSKESNDRSRGLSTSRGLVNNFSGFKLGKKFIQPSSNAGVVPILIKGPSLEDMVKSSPYVIFPEDELIFGWQYPIPRDLINGLGSDSYTAGYNKMTLFGNTKLTFYGSQVKNGKEFHEGLNQNLTSNAVHEVIGNEPVVDQFDISERGELTGSFEETHSYSLFNDQFIVGDLLFDSFETNFGNLSVKRLFDIGMKPGTRVNSLPTAGGGAGPGNNTVGLLDLPNASGDYAHINRFKRMYDTERVYSDARIIGDSPRGPFYGGDGGHNTGEPTFTLADRGINRRFGTEVGDYGSMQTYQEAYLVRLGGSPKYYFNRNSYGQFADFIRQGLDGKFTRKLKRVPFGTVTSPAVRVRFVEDDFDEDDLNFRKFSLVKPSDVDNTAYETFQSSNISLFATSSVPFIEGWYWNATPSAAATVIIEFDGPTNRNYSVAAVEVS